LKFSETILKGSYLIELSVHTDSRGGFARTFCKREFEQIGHHKEFVQFNHVYNIVKGTIRGMHYQLPPFKEVKLFRCIKGAVWDVIVDVRKDSPTFLQHFAVELSEKNRLSVYAPEGFAHGYQTLTDEAEMIYSHTEYYEPSSNAGLNYADPALGITWKLPATEVSEKDKTIPLITSTFKGI
jgi:dTDP-4-dehydrorhamnose 3,5-epimerase